MPIDPSIALQVKPFRLQDPLQSAGNVLQILNAIGQQKAQEYKLSQLQRDDERDRNMRAALANLPADANQEALIRAIAPYSSADTLLKTQQSSLDRRATSDNTKQIALSRLQQTIHRDAATIAHRERTATTEQEKFHWRKQMDALEARFKQQSAEIQAGRYTYDTGGIVSPFLGQIPQPGAPPQSAPPGSPPAAPLAAPQAAPQAAPGRAMPQGVPLVPHSQFPRVSAGEQQVADAFAGRIAANEQAVAAGQPGTLPPAAPVYADAGPPRQVAPPTNLDRWDRAAASAVAPTAAPTPSAPATPQRMTLADAPAGLSQRDKARWLMDREKEYGRGVGGGRDLTPEAIEQAAARYAIDRSLPPNLGRGAQGAYNTSIILNKAAENAAASGNTPETIALQQIAGRANSQALGQLVKQKNLILAFEKNALMNADLVLDRSEKVDRLGSPIIDRWIQAGKKQIAGDVAVAELDAAMRTFVNEYARITTTVTGGGVTSDTARREIDELLRSAQTKEQVRGVVSLMKQEMENRRKGYEQQEASLKGEISGRPQAPTAPNVSRPRAKNPTTGETVEWDGKQWLKVP